MPRLLYLEKILGINSGSYGSRTNDPEWSAAEFVTQFRLPHNYVPTDERFTPVTLHDGTLRGMLQRWQGGIYVTHQIHQDIEFLYRVVCGAKWQVKIFEPKHDSKHDISSFEEVTDQYNIRTGKKKRVAVSA